VDHLPPVPSPPERGDSAPWLAFGSRHRASPSAIAALDRNGEFRRLTDADQSACSSGDVASVGLPRWSPDGSMLSFIQVVVTTDTGCDDRMLESRLVVMHADGSEERALVAYRYGIEQAGWAPDASSIYYTLGDLDGLWSVGTDGSAPMRINSLKGWQQVSPSGGRVAVISGQALDQSLLVASIDGSAANEIAPVGPYSSGRDLRWFPEGRWVTALRTTHRATLLMIRADGSSGGRCGEGACTGWTSPRGEASSS
jgi:Tol biopolymer transport system component